MFFQADTAEDQLELEDARIAQSQDQDARQDTSKSRRDAVAQILVANTARRRTKDKQIKDSRHSTEDESVLWTIKRHMTS